jgi:tripartite-type tricarboxylate transporter receptor subunit TctC
MTNAYPYVLMVSASVPARTLQEFVALAKREPEKMNSGTTGGVAANHLMSELFTAKAGLKMTHVPYRGTASWPRPGRRRTPSGSSTSKS